MQEEPHDEEGVAEEVLAENPHLGVERTSREAEFRREQELSHWQRENALLPQRHHMSRAFYARGFLYTFDRAILADGRYGRIKLTRRSLEVLYRVVATAVSGARRGSWRGQAFS